MSDGQIIECYPNPSLFECKSLARLIDPIAGGALCIPMYYYTVQIIRHYYSSKDKNMRAIAWFFVLTSFSLSALVFNCVVPNDVTNVSYVTYFYQLFPRFAFSLSHCVLAEQTVTILILIEVPFSKLLKYCLIFVKFILMIATAVFAFMPIYTYGPVNNYSVFMVKIQWYDYFTRFLTVCEVSMKAIFIITTTIAFVFIPRISDLFEKKFIYSMRVLLVLITLFTIMWLVFFTYQSGTIDFNRVIAIDSIDYSIIILVILNIVVEYVPRVLFASAMWFLASNSKEEEPEDLTRNGISTQELYPEGDSDDDGFLPQ